MKRAFAYVRYSSAVQAKGDSVERQRSPLALFCAQNGYELAEVFTDEGISGYTGENIKKGKFKEILEKIESGEIAKGDVLLIESIDRISRQQLDKTAMQLYSILAKGINIYTTNDERLYSLEDKNKDLENYLMIGLISKRSHEESVTKSKRRKSAWNKAKLEAERGKVFSVSNNTPYGLKVANGKFEIVESEAKEIRFIFENLKYEGASATIRKVNEFAVNRRWNSRQVHFMIQNKYPIGVYTAKKREEGKKVKDREIENYYPKIVEESTFYEAVQAMHNRRNKKDFGMRSTGNINIFRGCTICAECKGGMVFLRNKNNKNVHYSYFTCFKRKEEKIGCKDQFFKYEYAVAMICSFVEYILDKKNEKKLDEICFVIKKLLTEKSDNENKEKIKNIETEMYKENDKIKNLEEAISETEGKIPSFLIKKLQESEERVERLKYEMDSIKTEKESLEVAKIEDFLELIYNEKGRLKINTFFKNNGVCFSFLYVKEERKLMTIIKKDGCSNWHANLHYKLRDDPILKKYKLENINNYI